MSRSRQITGIRASTAWPITAVSAARSLGATISRPGFWRMKVSTSATCLLLSCCASEITSFTSGYCANSFAIRAFCAARYGSALLAWLKATTSCFFPPPAQEVARRAAARPAAMRNPRIIFTDLLPGARVSPALHRYRQHDDHGFDHHFHVAVDVVEAEHVGQHSHYEGPHDGTGNRSFAAGEGRAADHHRGDGVELIGHSGVGIALVILGGVEHARKAGEQAG